MMGYYWETPTGDQKKPGPTVVTVRLVLMLGVGEGQH